MLWKVTQVHGLLDSFRNYAEGWDLREEGVGNLVKNVSSASCCGVFSRSKSNSKYSVLKFGQKIASDVWNLTLL
jgi:hypothetical protein